MFGCKRFEKCEFDFDCNQCPNMGRTCKYNSSKHKWLSITYVLKTTNQTVRVQTRHKGIMTWRHVLKLYTNVEWCWWCLIRKSGRSWISWISIFWINQLCPSQDFTLSIKTLFIRRGCVSKGFLRTLIGADSTRRMNEMKRECIKPAFKEKQWHIKSYFYNMQTQFIFMSLSATQQQKQTQIATIMMLEVRRRERQTVLAFK